MAGATWREFLTRLLESEEYRTQTRFLPPGYELTSHVNGFPFRFRTADREMGARMALGLYEPSVTRALRRLARSCKSLVDCGANTGFITCTFLSAAGPDARVTAFEPMPECAEMFRKNVALNDLVERVTLIEAACGDVAGEIRMSSVSNMMVGAQHGDPAATVRPVVKLDEVVKGKVDIVKLDIEGAEPQAIRGMTNLLYECRPILVTELNDYWLRRVGNSSARDYLAQLEELGYRVMSAESWAAGKPRPVHLRDDDPLFVTDAVAEPVR